jgi:hypothetical protein
VKLNLHARIEIAAVAVLLLTSCTLDDQQRDEVADIAADVAHDTVLEHDAVLDLESRVSEIESRLNM